MLSYGSRKFIIAISSELLASVLVACESITSADYRSITIAVIGLYAFANVAQKAVTKNGSEES